MDKETILVGLVFLVVVFMAFLFFSTQMRSLDAQNKIMDIRIWSAVTTACQNACRMTDTLFVAGKSMYEDFRTCECLDKQCMLDLGHEIQGESYSFDENALQACSHVLYVESRI